MKQITAIIPTFNEAHNISAAIDSVSWADEVLVVDSFSTDDTVKIAADKGARVIQRSYENSASQKNWAIPQAKFEWIFLLDADERVDEALRREVQSVLKMPEDFQAYWIKRRNFFLGKEVKYSGWQGDKVVRLFKRDNCSYERKSVHAEVICDGKVGVLKARLLHYTYKDLYHYLEKWDRYTSWSAQDRAMKGEVPGIFHFLIKPFYRFVHDYVLKLGFLDGLNGLIVCTLSSMAVFMRYLKVKQILSDKKKTA